MAITEHYTSELFQFVQDHLQEDPAQLLLRHSKKHTFDIKLAVGQIAARQKAKSKLPLWAANPSVIFPKSISLEQCSSEETANFKRSLVNGHSLIDLTGGFGVDTFLLGQDFSHITYIEREEDLASIVTYNFSKLSQDSDKYQTINADAIDYLSGCSEQFDVINIDPARRGGHNQKLYRLGDCVPDVCSHWPLLSSKAKVVMIKASPMLDLKEALRELPEITELHVVAHKNEVKEVLLIWRAEASQDLSRPIYAWELSSQNPKPFTFDFESEAEVQVALGMPGRYLVIPNAAILKSGAFKSFAQQYELAKLHTHTHLYSGDVLSDGIPGRVFEVMEEVKLDKKSLRKKFNTGTVNVLSRNHPMKAEAIKQKYKLKDGGEDFLIACTLMDGRAAAYHCKKVDE